MASITLVLSPLRGSDGEQTRSIHVASSWETRQNSRGTKIRTTIRTMSADTGTLLLVGWLLRPSLRSHAQRAVRLHHDRRMAGRIRLSAAVWHATSRYEWRFRMTTSERAD